MRLFIALVRVVVVVNLFLFLLFFVRHTKCDSNCMQRKVRAGRCVLVCRQFTDNHSPRNWFRKESLEILWKCGTFSNEFYFWIEITMSAISVSSVRVCVWLKRSEVRLLSIPRTHTRHVRLNNKKTSEKQKPKPSSDEESLPVTVACQYWMKCHKYINTHTERERDEEQETDGERYRLKICTWCLSIGSEWKQFYTFCRSK